MANEILNQHVVENGTNFCVFSKKGKSHRLIRTDRLSKYCVFIKEVPKIPV